MTKPVLDHIAIGAERLEPALQALAQSLGVRIPLGGKHPIMSTHNAVMQSQFHGDPHAPCYIEVISSDPDAPPPARPRWFSLDEEATKTRLAKGPAPLCWVVRCEDIDAHLAGLPDDLRSEIGPVITMSRGDLSWRLTVPETGGLGCGGLLPVLIEWQPGPHISLNQTNLGVSIRQIELTTPDAASLEHMLTALDVLHLVQVEKGPENIRFHLDMRGGETKILSRS